MSNIGKLKLNKDVLINIGKGTVLNIEKLDSHFSLASASIYLDSDSYELLDSEIKPDYLQSNRYKLSQFIKAQPFKAIELSVAIGHQATYLSSTASKSRFESRGDISDAQLHRIANEVNNKVLELKSAEEYAEDLKDKNSLDFDKLKKSYGVGHVDESETTQALSEIKTPSIHGTVKALPDLDSYTPIQCRELKSIQVSNKTVWFTVFLITVLIVSLLATLIYLA